ncbi:DUF1878 family protein [Robertmurraya andreesenii]|uniref:DUF1878 domain-containing protein n=1 Tax=Anoxybacillus andreesenii TaxID=1325932 RepID=A0ABT9UYN0_9BACL|nr:DUF1878 family protein [Robertmurraya andreesenii]MDQ0153750.1 hypothetical protein [Robertmurraya andreesenii]
MNLDVLLEKINRLEFHQSLLLKMIVDSEDHFYRMIIEKSLTEQDLKQFYQSCDELTVALEEQKAEGFVNFEPLFQKFKAALHPNLIAEEVVHACLRQQLYRPLMLEFRKFI